MSIKIAINGTGRIGLCAARIASSMNDVEIVAINSTCDIDTLVHLLKYDSVHGECSVTKSGDNTISINDGRDIKILSNRDPALLDFGDAICVLECTGKFNSAEKSKAHIKGNVKKVVISAPADNTPTFVYGVNHLDYKGESIISNASCTTNCLAPIVKLIDENFVVKHGLMTTIHSYTNDQNLLDVKHKDLRRARAAALNMIPTSTGAAKAISLVLPHLKGKLDGIAVRVPTPDVSLVDVSFNVEKEVGKEIANEVFYKAQESSMKGLILVDDEKRVSSDFIGSSFSAIIVPDKTITSGNNIKILAWYDNEVGYTYRLLDMCKYVCGYNG